MRAASDHLSAPGIAAEMARTRARLSHGLARLDRDYALRPLLLRGCRLAMGAATPDVIPDHLRRALVLLAMVGIGLTWLAASGRRPAWTSHAGEVPTQIRVI